MTMRHLALAAAATLGLCVSAPAAAQTTNPETARALVSLAKYEERVTHIGERLSLAAASAGWCSGGQSVGWALGEVGQYPKNLRQAVRMQWSIPTGANLFVTAVAPGSPADQAGITVGTGIVSIEGRAPMRNTYQVPSPHAREASERLIDRSLAEGPLDVVVLGADGVRRTLALTPRATCLTRFLVGADNEEQAYADGENVLVTAGMGEFTGDNEQELAAVIAHELAHNILRHVARTEEAGTPDNYTRFLRRYLNINRSMEEEADRLSVWLLQLAGYDPTAPVTFWERFGPGHDSAHPFGRTHDRWQDRVAALQNEIAAMQTAKAADANARPSLLDRADDVPVPGDRPVIGHPAPGG